MGNPAVTAISLPVLARFTVNRTEIKLHVSGGNREWNSLGISLC